MHVSLLLLWRCRHQYIWWDGVEGSAGGEDREDLSRRSRLHLWSAQGNARRKHLVRVHNVQIVMKNQYNLQLFITFSVHLWLYTPIILNDSVY